MRNLISYLFVVFSMFSAQLAQAVDCETAGEAKLSELKYVGTDLIPLLKSKRCTVVKAYNDDEGRIACGGKGAALNPGNPQYTGHEKWGSPSNNKLGYYFCVSMDKKAMCDERIKVLESTMDIEWQRTGSSVRNDGNCVCRAKDDKSAKMLKCPTSEAAVDAMRTGAATNCAADSGAGDDGSGNCRCLAGELKGQIVPASGKCPEPVAQVTPNVNDNDLEQCVAELKAAKQLCSEKGKSAIDKCSKEAPEVNKNVSEAQRVMSIGLDAIIAKNAGTGALATCAKMGAAGTTLIEALSLFRENCKKELEGCKKGCEDVSTLSKKTNAEYIQECEAKFQAAQPPKLLDEAHKDRLKVMLGELRDLGNNAEKFCKGDVQKNENQLNGFLEELATSVQKANICECQLTSASTNTGQTPQENCSDLNTPLTCIQNVNQPGCSFSTVGCTPDSQLPNCRNPNVAINPNGSGVGMPASGFAGPGFGSGAGGGGSGAGKTAVGAGDLSGLYDETRPSGSGTATADAGSPFGAAGAAGSFGGGGGGGGGGGSEGGGAAGEEKDKGGLSGLFQSTKASINSLFGGGSDNKGSATKKPDNKAYKNDVNGFRPKANARGLANEGQFGGKNRDIWKTMNERYNDQYHTFITVESPSK